MYYAQFGAHMPDLNFDNAQLRDEIFRIGKFWAEEVKVDGFRLDAARHIFPDDRVEENYRWWEYFRQEMLKINKDFYLVGEVWAPAEVAGLYLKGIPALFDFDLAGAIIKSLATGRGDSLAIMHKKIREYYKTINPDYVDATFLSNHDQNRIMSMLNDDEAKARLAASILLTLPGSPYLYYGEEIGMKGKKPDEQIREPFIWDIKPRDNIRATWEAAKFSTDTSVTSAELQDKNDQSLLNHYRTMIRLRSKTKSLARGEMVPVKLDVQSVVAFTRTFEDETLLVMHNVSGVNAIFELPATVKEYKREFFKTNGSNLDDKTVTIPPYSTLILKGQVLGKGW
jgi:glycosidase